MNFKLGLRRTLGPLVNQIIKDRLIRMAALIQHLAAIYPHDVDKSTYTLPAFPAAQRHSGSPFPIPPEPLWAAYCTSVETYLQSGLDDIAMMKRLLDASGAPIAEADRILEIGVAGGRLIRHLGKLAQTHEIWGIDHWATAILWCKEHLSPPFHFATTTMTPHLPFEDNYFGLVFAGSVWTHLDDLAEAWALEVRRVLRHDGRFYFTINDRSAVKVFQGGGKDRERYVERIRPDNWQGWLALLDGHAGYQRFARGEAQMVTMGRSTNAHVLWDADYLIKRFGPGWRLCSITPEAYGHQTGVLLAKA
jgi:SAM-dependent methyltransferase